MVSTLIGVRGMARSRLKVHSSQIHRFRTVLTVGSSITVVPGLTSHPQRRGPPPSNHTEDEGTTHIWGTTDLQPGMLDSMPWTLWLRRGS